MRCVEIFIHQDNNLLPQLQVIQLGKQTESDRYDPGVKFSF